MVSSYQVNPTIRKASQDILDQLLKEGELTSKILSKLCRKAASVYKISCPSKMMILEVYRDMMSNHGAEYRDDIMLLLKKSDIRSLSGVTIIAIATGPYPCPGRCVYCPTEKGMPKSYNSNEPAIMRAILNNWDPYRQVMMRLKVLHSGGHSTDKIELIVLGGTFSSHPKNYQTTYIRNAYKALNDGIKSKDTKLRSLKFSDELKRNESAKHRCVGLTLETRPDWIDIEEVKRMRKFGATRVEIGVQSVNDDILKLIKRDHDVASTIKATKLLKEAGFKVCYHTMPNLPGSNLEEDIKMYRKLFSDPDFQPDQIKIYPCVVTKDAELYDWYKDNRFKPYTEKELVDLLIEIKKLIPPYCRIVRLGRDIPAPNIMAGNKFSNIRQIVNKKMKKLGLSCACIRCREVRRQSADREQAVLKTLQYDASGGCEYFLSYETSSSNILFAHLRLRIPEATLKGKKHFIRALQGAVIIREVHTYGESIPIDEYKKRAVQHIGFGKKLITEAENIAIKNGIRKIAVISGIGVRDYYRKLGYRLVDEYMVKDISNKQ